MLSFYETAPSFHQELQQIPMRSWRSSAPPAVNDCRQTSEQRVNESDGFRFNQLLASGTLQGPLRVWLYLTTGRSDPPQNKKRLSSGGREWTCLCGGQELHTSSSH